jgi:hypothetical protein
MSVVTNCHEAKVVGAKADVRWNHNFKTHGGNDIICGNREYYENYTFQTNKFTKIKQKFVKLSLLALASNYICFL